MSDLNVLVYDVYIVVGVPRLREGDGKDLNHRLQFVARTRTTLPIS
jgi:hypothetical protein